MIWTFILHLVMATKVMGDYNQIRIPILEMKLIDWQPYSSNWKSLPGNKLEVAKKAVALHLADKMPQKYNIESLYEGEIGMVHNDFHANFILKADAPPASAFRDFDYHWSVLIPFSDINGTQLERSDMLHLKMGQVQEMMLNNITKKMVIQLSKVAERLGVPERNLSYSYDPEKWENVVHAMVEEGIENYLRYLNVKNEDRLASLFGLTTIQLKNSTIDVFLGYLPPLLPKKDLMDKNTTSNILGFLGMSAVSSDAVIYSLVNQTTQLTADQFSILYNLTAEQKRAIERSTLLQVSQSCGIEMSQILSKTIPKLAWDTVGDSILRSVSCVSILKVKGATINALPGLTDPASKTILQILLRACGQYWKSCRSTMSLGTSEWECIASKSLNDAASIVGISVTALRDSPVNDIVAAMTAKCKSGSVSLAGYRSQLQGKLRTLFNLTLTEVETLLGTPITQVFTAPQLVRAFLNASSLDLKIDLNTMHNTTTKTHEEFLDSPPDELSEVIPFSIRSAVTKPASQLHMSWFDTLKILKLNAESSSIGQYKHAARFVLPAIIISKNKFENTTFGSLLSSESISDNVSESSMLTLLMRLSGFDLETMTTIYRMNNAQVSVLQSLLYNNLKKYCALDSANVNAKPCFNITAQLVGIEKLGATCNATQFYVSAKHDEVQELETLCPSVKSTSTSLLQMIEECSGLRWHYSAKFLGVHLKDWVQIDILNRLKLATHSQLNADSIKVSTFESLLTSANQIHATKESYKQELATYSVKMRTKLYSTYSTNKEEVASALEITTAYLDSLSLLETVDKVQEFLQKKYTISLSTTAAALDTTVDDMKYLAHTEWAEMIPFLKIEIIASGSLQLGVTENNFKSLLGINDVSNLIFSDLVKSWDTHYTRLLDGKTLSENKTFSDIQTLKGISSEMLLKITLLGFYKDHLNLTKHEMSILFEMSLPEIDILTKFTMEELPCSCKFSDSHLLSLTPRVLLDSMVGRKDMVSCRSIAVLDGFNSLSLDKLSEKFNVTFNDTESMLEVVQSLSDLPYEKISWGLDIQLSDWPLFSAVSLQDLATTTSRSLATLRNMPFRNVTKLLIKDRNQFQSQVQARHAFLLAKASRIFSLPSTDVCGQCAIPSVDVLKTFLNHLGGTIYLNPKVIPPVDGFDCIAHDIFLLQPSKWPLLVPGIIPKSFKNVSSILQSTETDFEDILGLSRSTIFNMTLTEYLQLFSSRIRPMVECFNSIHTDIAWKKVSAKGKDASSMKSQTVLQVISEVCSNVNVYNMSAIMGWKTGNLSILQNTSLEDAALCKRLSIQSILSRNILALANMMIQEIHGCTVIPCRTGTIRDEVHYNCSDVNECKRQSICERNQYCQNYFGGHECECTIDGHCLAGKVCDKCLRFFLLIVFDVPFTINLGQPLTLGFYIFKEKVQSLVNGAFKDIPEYRECRLIKNSEGSVHSELSVYTSTQYKGTSDDLQEHFKSNLNKTQGQTYLGGLKVKSATLSDYNECSRNQVSCHKDATCVNKEGTYTCKCNSGYEGDGVTCKAGFLKSYWWLVILLAVILLIIIIAIIVLVVKKPKLKSFRVDDETVRAPPMKRANSNLSYKSGDVYFKDKQGNIRTGNQYAADPMDYRNPLYGKEIPENVYDNNDSRSPSDIVAMDNLGADPLPRDEETIEIEMKSTIGDYGTTKQNGIEVDDKML